MSSILPRNDGHAWAGWLGCRGSGVKSTVL
jgi:hypothetical protein